LDSAESPEESTDAYKTRGSLFGIGSNINQKIKNKRKLVSSIIGKKRSIKNRRAVLDSPESPEENMDASKARGSWFGIGSLIKQKIQNKKKFVSSIIGKKKSIKNRRAVLDSADIDVEKMLTNADASKTRGSWFGIGSLIQQKIQNKKKVISSFIKKKKATKTKGSLSHFRKF